jgi:glycosyltransferase involved in cell wall biosynthesis
MSPLKMFDYLASSNVIIASDLTVYKHILKDKYNSILIDNSKTNLWIEWINRIFKSSNTYSYLKKNAFRTAKKYTWEKRSEIIIKFVNKEFF